MSTASIDPQAAIDKHQAWLKERATRAAANVQISASVPSVIERISSPVIAPVRPVLAAVPTADAPVERVKGASFLALQRMGLIGLKKACDDIYLVIAAACMPVLQGGMGVADLTRREVRELAEKRFERRIDDAWISARVFELVFADRVLERPVKRLCTLSGTDNLVGAVYVVPKQVRLVY